MIMRAAPQQVDRFWASDWSLRVLLALLVLFVFFIHPLNLAGYDTRLVAGLAFTVILLSGILVVSRSPTQAVLFAIVAIAAVSVHWARYAVFGAAWVEEDAIASLVACGMLAGIVLSQVFRSGPVTSSRIQGAVAAYLLIALMFAALYSWIDLHSAMNAFNGVPPLVGAGPNPFERFVYFSFTTMTTVGYGDITPVQPFARSMAMLEAVIGQIFPAILLARLVSMEVYYHQQRVDALDRDAGTR